MDKPFDPAAAKKAFQKALANITEIQSRPVVIPDYKDVVPCSDCGHPMTDEERYFYEKRCERCEGEWFERIEAWRHGEAEDEELNQTFSVPKPTKH